MYTCMSVSQHHWFSFILKVIYRFYTVKVFSKSPRLEISRTSSFIRYRIRMLISSENDSDFFTDIVVAVVSSTALDKRTIRIHTSRLFLNDRNAFGISIISTLSTRREYKKFRSKFEIYPHGNTVSSHIRTSRIIIIISFFLFFNQRTNVSSAIARGPSRIRSELKTAFNPPAPVV